MKFKGEECRQLERMVSIILDEAVEDFTYSTDISVVDINGRPLVFNRDQIKILMKIKDKIELGLAYN